MPRNCRAPAEADPEDYLYPGDLTIGRASEHLSHIARQMVRIHLPPPASRPETKPIEKPDVAARRCALRLPAELAVSSSTTLGKQRSPRERGSNGKAVFSRRNHCARS